MPVPSQVLEQHSAPDLQELPDVVQAAFNGAHTPLAQEPPQHCALLVHFWLSETQAAAAHCLFSQRRLQQSVAEAQASVAEAHVVSTDAQLLLLASHTPEQQSLPEAQRSAYALHAAAPEPAPPEPVPAVAPAPEPA